jgi:hypothetical protein
MRLHEFLSINSRIRMFTIVAQEVTENLGLKPRRRTTALYGYVLE